MASGRPILMANARAIWTADMDDPWKADMDGQYKANMVNGGKESSYLLIFKSCFGVREIGISLYGKP